MPTKKRKQSESGFYHVFQRGVNHFDIFEDDDDRDFFLAKMTKFAKDLSVEIHAWCLMSNHVHLLLKANGDRLSAMMRRLGSVYARRFNARHGRSGPLFEGRFCSVCVETDPQLIAVVRYIHRNPVHHDERTLYGDYPWSSYGEYIASVKSKHPATPRCKVAFVLSVIGNLAEFIRIHEEERDDERHIDIGSTGLMGDDEARSRANRVLARNGFKTDISEIGILARELRNEALYLVKRSIGCSMRQMQRLTAIAYSAIRNAIEKPSEEIRSGHDALGFVEGKALHPVESVESLEESASVLSDTPLDEIEGQQTERTFGRGDAVTREIKAPTVLGRTEGINARLSEGVV